MRELRTQEEIMQNWKGDIDKPLVSVCCITYNHEHYIEDALEGFLIQETDFPFEIIIRDDASPDKTADIIRKYEAKYPNIIKPIYEKENGYQKGIKAMSVVIAKSKGEYIAICEGDDYWTDAKKLQLQKDFLDKNEEYIICYHDIEAFNENGDLEKKYGGATRDVEAIELQKCTSLYTMTVCFRNMLKDFPYEFGCSKFGDLFIWSLLGHYGNGKFIQDIKPSRYRVHDGGIFSNKSANVRRQMWIKTSAALYAYYNRIGNEELASYFLQKNLTSSIQEYGLFNLLRSYLKKILNKYLG